MCTGGPKVTFFFVRACDKEGYKGLEYIEILNANHLKIGMVSIKNFFLKETAFGGQNVSSLLHTERAISAFIQRL